MSVAFVRTTTTTTTIEWCSSESFNSAVIPVTKEPTGLSRTDGKCPDGMTLILWQAVMPVILDITVACTSADSYIEACAVVEIATTCKMAKYTDVQTRFVFHPIAVETQARWISWLCLCALVTSARVPYCFSAIHLPHSGLSMCCCMSVFVLSTSRIDGHWWSFQSNFFYNFWFETPGTLTCHWTHLEWPWSHLCRRWFGYT